MKTPPCCPAWATALEDNTDNEGYSSLLYISDNNEWTMGAALPGVKFCPWCGASKSTPTMYDESWCTCTSTHTCEGHRA